MKDNAKALFASAIHSLRLSESLFVIRTKVELQVFTFYFL